MLNDTPMKLNRFPASRHARRTQGGGRGVQRLGGLSVSVGRTSPLRERADGRSHRAAVPRRGGTFRRKAVARVPGKPRALPGGIRPRGFRGTGREAMDVARVAEKAVSAVNEPRAPVLESRVVHIGDIRCYEHNPRRAPNAEYGRIKASIRAGGLAQPLVVTKRSGETGYRVDAERQHAPEDTRRTLRLQTRRRNGLRGSHSGTGRHNADDSTPKVLVVPEGERTARGS